MRVSLFHKIIPSFIRIPLAVILRKTGISTAVQSALCLSEARSLARAFKPSGVNHDSSKVLIVCAHFNHLDWLPGCVDSVLAQTHQNFQLIVVDDSSTADGAEKALATQAASDPRVKAIQLEENSGAYVARNTALEAADNDWTHITFIDPDDLAYPGWLSHNLEVLGGKEGSVRPVLERWTPDLKKMKSMYFGFCQSLHSRSAFEIAGGFLPVRVSGDAELILRLSKLAEASDTILMKSFKPSQKMRLHRGSASQTSLNERKRWLEDRSRELDKTKTYYETPTTSPWRDCKL